MRRSNQLMSSWTSSQHEKYIAVLRDIVDEHGVVAEHSAVRQRQVQERAVHGMLVENGACVRVDEITDIGTVRESSDVRLGRQEIHPEGAIGPRQHIGI